jgi:hypothetical protein
MAGVGFFQTRMGQRFYEVTMPKIADQLARLNTNLEALVAELRKSNGSTTETPSHAASPASDAHLDG